jgi:hypothetical protein
VPDQSPIFIFGVPRSGTTLLRTVLDSHSAIACGPETPWLGGHQPRSVMELVRFLTEDEHGYCRSYGMSREVVLAAARRFVDDILSAYAAARGKRRWAEKTPDNVLYVDFLLELFPEAKILWLTRNGLDVAVSTSDVAEHRKGISPFLERNISLAPGAPTVANTPFNALLRWRHWSRLLARSLQQREHLKLSYERLVAEPEATMRQVCEFIAEPFEASMLDYTSRPHDFPGWEWGSADVRARGTISRERAGRAQKELSPVQLAVLQPLAAGPTGQASMPLSQEAAGALAEALSSLARSFKLRAMEGLQPDVLGWLWTGGVVPMRLESTRFYDIDGPVPLPIVLSLLGARTTSITADPPLARSLTALAKRLRLGLDVAVLSEARIPAPDGKADLLAALWPLAWGDGVRLAQEAARVLKPGGVLLVAGELASAAAKNPAFEARLMPGGQAAILRRL